MCLHASLLLHHLGFGVEFGLHLRLRLLLHPPRLVRVGVRVRVRFRVRVGVSTLSQDSMQIVKSRVFSAAACALRRTWMKLGVKGEW